MGRRESNIYHGLIVNENTLTEAFCNLLAFDSFRRAFAEFLTHETGEEEFEFRYEGIISQCREEGEGQPDIRIETTDNRIILIENKINYETELTPAQRQFYKDKKYSFILIFFLPDQYKHEEAIPNQHLPKNVYKLRWSRLHEFMKGKNFDDNIAVRHFIEILGRWFCMPEIQFSIEEVKMIQQDKSIPRIISGLSEIITQVAEILRRQEVEIVWEFNADGGNIYLKDKGQRILWFGFWYVLWKEYMIPLAFGVCDGWFPKEIVAGFLEIFPDPKEQTEQTEKDGKYLWYCHPLPEHLYLNVRDKIDTDAIAKYLKDQYEKLRARLR